MNTDIIVVRHGETDWNREHRIQGHLAIGLNERGRAQAAALARRLARRPADEGFDALYSSDLLRARQTADAIARPLALSVSTDARLREWDLGVLAGETHASAQRRCPATLAIYREARPDAVVPGGESIRQRYRRVIAAVEDIARAHRGGRVLVVTHGGPLDDCYRRARGLSLEAPRGFDLLNASLNRFVLDLGRGEVAWTLMQWSDVAHLDGAEVLGSTAGVAGAPRKS